jgi:putative lipoprotein
MRLSNLLLTLPVCLLAACSTPTTPTQTITAIEQQPTTVPVIKQDFTQILADNFRGQLYFEGNNAYFTGCESGHIFLIQNNPQLAKIYQRLNTQGSLPVYTEFTGEIIFPEDENSKSDAVMRIDRVHHMALAKTSLQCAKPINDSLIHAKGEQPYWRLSIDGENVYFATKAQNQIYKTNRVNFQTTQINTIKSTNNNDKPLNVVIKPNECFNDNEYWGYSATITAENNIYKGCGEPGWAKIDASFAGYYLSETQGKTINLTLNKNGTVEYSKKASTDAISKTGYWKTNTPNRVVVMLTKAGDTNIREELVFTRNGLTLSTEQINNKNIIEKFNDALVFKKMNMEEVDNENAEPSITRNFTPELITPATNVNLTIQKAVDTYFKIHRTDPHNTQFNSVTYDLNGDKIKDAVVLLDWCSSKGCEMLIFEGTNNGYKFSSRISQVKVPVTIAKDQHFLWQSLLTEKQGKTLKIDFDGISYPNNTDNLPSVSKLDESTGVVLFSQGRPQVWFPIRP